MSDSDNIFREVEEDLRRDQLLKLWDRYGIHVLIAAGVLILFVGGFNIYRWYQHKQAMASGSTFFQATRAVEEQKYAEAGEALGKLAKEAPGGYRVLARLEQAAVHMKEGRKAEALALYDQVAGDSSADGILRDFARVQGAALRIDEAEPAEIAKRLDKLDADSSPWRYSARELLALAAYRSGNAAESEKLLTRILSDPFAPAEMRKRAESLIALLIKTGAAGAAAEAGQTPATPQKDAATQ
jgi:hypothetical protein